MCLEKDFFPQETRILVSNGSWIFYLLSGLFSRDLISAFDLQLQSVLINIFCGPEVLLPTRSAWLLAVLYRGFLFTDNRRPKGKKITVSALFLVLAFYFFFQHQRLNSVWGNFSPCYHTPKIPTLLRGLQNGTRVFGFLPKESARLDSESKPRMSKITFHWIAFNRSWKKSFSNLVPFL